MNTFLPSEFIEKIYTGAFEEGEPWRDMLLDLAVALDARFTVMVLQRPSDGDGGTLLCPNGIPEVEEAWRERFFVDDPFLDLPLDQVVTLVEDIPESELMATEFYLRVMRPSGILDMLGVDLQEPDGVYARLRAVRTDAQGVFGRSEIEFLEAMRPHLRHSLRAYSRLVRLESERDLYRDMVGEMAIGTILLNSERQVTQINAAARRVLDEADGLRIVRGRFETGATATTGALNRLIDAACEAAAGRPHAPQILRIERPSGGGHLGLMVRRMPETRPSDDPTRSRVAVCIGARRPGTPASAVLLQDVFGLTQAEARVAALIAQGMALPDAALALNVSRNTIRTHLRAIYAKCGVDRQAALVTLLLETASALWPSQYAVEVE
ncbi:MAG: helix-turn-helix transcriptional regulator [Deltaproteobacteria bacterium]|nr:helix-turn-helix transcriptional regulator [Deltaproteobacteria bacterium]MBW2396395.1 helix-turn-helix transcriptional regulator [Deltaproteobacteria bacterium]